MGRVEQVRRIIFLRDLLTTRTHLDTSNIAKSFGVSQRTLYRDLRLLRTADTQLETLKGLNDHRTQIFMDDLTEQEVAALLAILKHNICCNDRSLHGAAWDKFRARVVAAIESQIANRWARVEPHLRDLLNNIPELA